MIDVGFDFTGRHVLVTGGTRGLGLSIAQAFLESGARVSITGTKILPSLYDADLSRFEYHQLRLTSSEAIDSFVERIGALDVLVNAAGARLSTDLAEHEREFVCHSARLGFVGPLRLTQQSASAAVRLERTRRRRCGAHRVHGPLARATQTPADAEAGSTAQTSRTGGPGPASAPGSTWCCLPRGSASRTSSADTSRPTPARATTARATAARPTAPC